MRVSSVPVSRYDPVGLHAGSSVMFCQGTPPEVGVFL